MRYLKPMQEEKKEIDSLSGQAGGGFDLALQGIIFLGVAAIMAAIFLKILVGFKDGETESDVNDTIDDGINAIKELTSWFETIALVIAGVIILSLVFLVVNVATAGSGRGFA